MNQPSPQPDSPSVKRGYMPDTLRLRWPVLAVVAMLVGGAAMFAGLWWLLKAADNIDRPVDQPRSTAVNLSPQLDGPPLQPIQPRDLTPSEDLAAMHRHEDAVFAALDWKTDEATGQPRVPDEVIASVAAKQQATTRPATRKLATQPYMMVAPGADAGGAR